MKNVCITFLMFLSTAFSQGLYSQEIDFQKIGDNVAATVAAIEPGETVLIYGGEHVLDLMEAIAVGVHKRGGSPLMTVVTDKTELSFITNIEEEYFLSMPDAITTLIGNFDACIMLLPEIENIGAWRKRKDELSETMQKSLEERTNKQEEAMMKAKTRILLFQYPVERDAEIVGLDYNTYSTEILNGLTADSEKMRKTGEKLEKMLKRSREVRITTPAGTDVTFQTTGRKVILMDGSTTAEDKGKPLMERVESVPGGVLAQSIHEQSARGKLVIPELRCNNLDQIKNLSVPFSNGMMGTLSGGGKDCIEDALKAFKKDARLLGGLIIGLNTEIHVIEEGKASFRPDLAGGKVTLYVGNNEYWGGENKVEGGYGFSITNATVSIDGHVVVKDGVLQEL